MVAVTGGSFDLHHRRAAGRWILSTRDRRWSVSGACPADGELESLDSYRAELEALPALLYFNRRLRHSFEQFTKEVHLVVWIDNK